MGAVPGNGGEPGGGGEGGAPPGPPAPPAPLQRLALGLDPRDAPGLRHDVRLLEEALELWRYARSRNAKIREEFDLLADFAFGKQFLAYGDELSQLTSRPKRNMVWDIVRHKKALVTEVGATIEALPRGPDDGGRAQLAKALLDYNAERRDAGGLNRKDRVDLAATWAALVGTGILHQGWDPLSGQTAERLVDPRFFDPDPDHALQSDWLYCFETLLLPVATVRRLFPATGGDVGADSGPEGSEPTRRPWQSSSEGLNLAIRRGQGRAGEEGRGRGPDYATVVLFWSQGHFEEEERPGHVRMRCDLCGGEFRSDPAAPDSLSLGALSELADGHRTCPHCGFGSVRPEPRRGGEPVPSYPRGRRLVVVAPQSRVLLYHGPWSTPELRGWPYKAMRWYLDPRRWWGIGEPQFQWSLQVLANKLLVLLAENATMNAAPKVVLPKGIGFEHKRWTNIPSEKLVATGDPRLIAQMRAFGTSEVPQSLVFLTQFVLRELRSQGGFEDVALGQLRSNVEISGRAIERAQSAAEVPVRDHLRQRYQLETLLAIDDLEMIRERWTAERALRIVDPWGNAEVRWLKGSELPELDVVVTSDPQELIDRGARVEIAVKLLGAPDPATGETALDRQGAAEYIGIPTRILKGVEARRAARREALERAPAPRGRTAEPPLGAAGPGPPVSEEDLLSALQASGAASGLEPGPSPGLGGV